MVMGSRVSCAWENHQFAPHSLLQPMKEIGARKDFAKEERRFAKNIARIANAVHCHN